MSLLDAVRAAQGKPPRWLDVRFDADKNPLHCSGNTVICHRRDEAGAAGIAEIVARIAASPAGDCFAFTAHESWHMTVFNGLLHEEDRRRSGFWPPGLPLDATDAEADAFMLDRMATIVPPERPVTMVATGFAGLNSHGLGIALVPSSADEERAIRAYRDLLANTVGLAGRPGHDTYAFHLTLAYLVRWPSEAAACATDEVLAATATDLDTLCPPFRLGTPEICLFDHMNEFRPQAPITSAQAAIPAE